MSIIRSFGLSPSADQHALADDVALNLTRAASDRVLPGAEHPVMPTRGIGDSLGRRVDGRIRAEEGGGEIGDPKGQLIAEKFEDRAFRARRLAGQSARQTAQTRYLQCLDVNCQLRELLSDVALVPSRLLARRKLLCEFGEAGNLRGMVAPSGAAALEHQCRDRDLPALVQWPDQIFLWHRHILEKDFVEVAVAVQEDEWADRNAGRLHVDQQIADAVMFGCFGISAHQ
jgi:hypothetical protein